MAEDIEVGRMSVPVFADLGPFKRQANAELREAARTAGRQAGKEAGDQIVAALEREYKLRIADTREELFRGMIDKKEAEKRGREAARDFNRGILNEIRRRATAGNLSRDAFIDLTDQLKDAGLRGADQATRGIQDRFTNLQGWVRGAFAAGIVGAFTLVGGMIIGAFRRVADFIQATLERAGNVQQIEESFRNITASRGLVSDDLIDRLRGATRGLVGDLELMKQANIAIQSGLPATEESLERLAFVSRRLARAVGRDATEAFQRLVNGIAKGEQQILEELGLMTRMEEALRGWERQTGRNSDALDQQQKILILYNAVMTEAEAKIAAMGDETLSSGERLRQFTTFVGNLRDRMAEAIADSPRIVQLLDSIGATAENSTSKIEDLVDTLGALFDVIVDSPLVSGSLEVTGKEVEIGGRALGFIGRNVFGIEEGELARAKALRQLNRAREERIQELRALESIEEVQRALSDNIREYEEATSGAAINVSKTNRLLEERRAIMQSLARIGREGAGAEAPEDPALARKREALEDRLAGELAKLTVTAADESALALQKLEAEIVEVYGRLSDEHAATLNRLRQAAESAANLEGLREQLRVASDATIETEEAAGAYARAVRQVVDAALELAQSSEDGTVAQREFLEVARQGEELLTRLAGVADQLAAGGVRRLADALEEIAAETPDSAEEIGRLASATQDLLQQAQQEAEAFTEGTKARDAYNKVIQDAIKLLKQLGKAAEDVAKAEHKAEEDARRAQENRLRDLRDQARTLEENARAAIQFAEALGLIDSKAATALQSVAQLGASIARIAGGDLSAIPSAIGAATSLIGGLFSESPEEKQRREVIEANTRALRELEQGIGVLNSPIGGVPGNVIAGVGQAARAAADTNFLVSGERRFERELNKLGLTMSQAEEVAAALGIELDGSKSSILALAEAINAAEFERLFETWGGRLELLRQEFELFDIEDPIEQLRRTRDLFLEFVELPAALEAQLAGLDLSTAEGRAEFERIIQEIFRMVASGQITPEMLGGLSVEDILNFIGDAEGLVDAAAETAEDGQTQAFQVSRSITEVTGNRLLGTLQTMSFWEEQTARGIAQMIELLGAAPPVLPGPGAVPGGTGVRFPETDPFRPAAPINVTLQVDSLIREVNAGPGFDSTQVIDAARRGGAAALEEIDRGLRLRVDDRRRALGA